LFDPFWFWINISPVTTLRQIRLSILIVMFGLVVSGVTAFPLLHEMNWISGMVAGGSKDPASHEGFVKWILTVLLAMSIAVMPDAKSESLCAPLEGGLHPRTSAPRMLYSPPRPQQIGDLVTINIEEESKRAGRDVLRIQAEAEGGGSGGERAWRIASDVRVIDQRGWHDGVIEMASVYVGRNQSVEDFRGDNSCKPRRMSDITVQNVASLTAYSHNAVRAAERLGRCLLSDNHTKSSRARLFRNTASSPLMFSTRGNP
jgi:hypothetical protein